MAGDTGTGSSVLPPPPVSSGTVAGSGSLDFGLGGTTTTAPTTSAASTSGIPSNLITPNMASASQYLLGEIGSDPVNLGFGLSGNGATTVDGALTWFLSLQPAQLYQVETQLYNAGYYVSGNNGEPLASAPVYGSTDPQSTAAFLQALAKAADTGSSASDVISEAISSGAGANNRSTLPTAQIGGGKVYTIDLTNPNDVAYTATQIFQAALGRNPTAAEDASITSMVNSQALAQGYAQEATGESQSKAIYNAQVNQRNIAYQYETTPKIALGAVPNGPIVNPQQWAVTLLQYLGDPTTVSNIQFLTGWAAKSGGSLASFNPLGALYQAPGSKPNASGPPAYPSWADSITSTVQALSQGGYTNIMAALTKGNATEQATSTTVASELSKWSNNTYSSVTPGPQAEAEAASAAASRVDQTSQTPQTQPPAPVIPGTNRNNAMAQGAAPDPNATPGITPGLTVPPGTTIAGLQSGLAPASVPASSSSTPAADVQPGQQTVNPGDEYLPPATSITTNPASAAADSYQEATTGANRPAFLGNEFLNAYQAILSMIKNGGPTVG